MGAGILFCAAPWQRRRLAVQLQRKAKHLSANVVSMRHFLLPVADIPDGDVRAGMGISALDCRQADFIFAREMPEGFAQGVRGYPQAPGFPGFLNDPENLRPINVFLFIFPDENPTTAGELRH